MPIGIKANPIIKKVGKTVPAVRIGCHAGNFCCLKALSIEREKEKKEFIMKKGNKFNTLVSVKN